MRKLLLIFTVVILLSSCHKQEPVGYVVNMDITYPERKPFYAVTEKENQPLQIDTFYSKDNFFRIKGKSDSLAILSLFNYNKNRLITLYVKTGMVIEVRGNGTEPKSLRISGSDLNNMLFSFSLNKQKLLHPTDSLSQVLLSLKKDSLLAAFDTTVINTISNKLSASYSPLLMYQYLLSPPYYTLCDSLYKQMDHKEITPIVRNRIINFLKYSAHTAIDSIMPNLVLRNEQDSILYLSTYYLKKKTKLYFWSINNPISREMIKEVATNKKNSNTLYISTDLNVEKWKEFLKKNNLRNNQQMRIPNGLQNYQIEQLSLFTLPYICEVDTAGRIIKSTYQYKSIESK